MPIGFQVVFRATEDQVLAPTPGDRMNVVGTLLRVGRDKGIFGVGVADGHAHAALVCTPVQLGRFVHDARLALSAALELPMAAPSTRPIRDVWHAENVLGYVHRQDTHHGVGRDTYRDGTTLPDLLGLRVGNGWISERVRTLLPRVTRADLLAHWGLESLEEGFDLGRLAEAGAAAAGVASFRTRSKQVVAARRACVAVAAGHDADVVARALGLSPRTVRRLRADEPPAAMVRAVRLQLGLRLGVAPPAVDFVAEPVGESYAA